MKTLFLWIAKICMLIVWGVFVVNLLSPFPKAIHISLNVMAIFMLIMHGLQVLLLTKLSTQLASKQSISKPQTPEISKIEIIQVWLFGSLAMISLKNRLMPSKTHENQ